MHPHHEHKIGANRCLPFLQATEQNTFDFIVDLKVLWQPGQSLYKGPSLNKALVLLLAQDELQKRWVLRFGVKGVLQYAHRLTLGIYRPLKAVFAVIITMLVGAFLKVINCPQVFKNLVLHNRVAKVMEANITCFPVKVYKVGFV